MNWLQIALALVQLAPELLKLIAQVETTLGAGNGPVKKALVMNAVGSAPPEIVNVIGDYVDKIIASKNLVEAEKPKP